MQKWEYLCLSPDEVQAKAKKSKKGTGNLAFDEGMNVLGEEGWELTAIGSPSDSGLFYCFKRPLSKSQT